MKTRIVRTLARATRTSARIAALPLAAAIVPAIAQAQRGQRELFEWRGTVDQEVRIQMRGGQTAVMGMGPREVTGYNDQVRAMSGVPATDGYVSVQLMQGRGRADVVQQPSAQNGYTTIVRVRDTQSGAGAYDIAAFWQPTGNSGYGNTGQYGVYGRQYPTGSVQQPVYRNGYPADQRYPVNQGGKQLPGAQQGNAPVYGRTSYPNGQRVTPNGRALPGAAQDAQDAQDAHSRRHGRKHRDQDQDDQRD